MSHMTREKIELVSRTKKVIGQLESALRALEEDAHCADVLQRLAAARGAINSLMGELMEDHILNHMPRKTKSSAEAAEDLIEIVRTFTPEGADACLLAMERVARDWANGRRATV